MNKSDLDRLMAAAAKQNQKYVKHAIESGVLPLTGLGLYDSPYWHYLKQNLCVADKSPLLRAMMRAAAIALYTSKEEPVMILGQSGSGKETFARMFADPMSKPFVAINCTGLPDYLVESELFGHVAGSFTGALHNKIGLALDAGEGVLFLDEIGDMPLSLQPKLLRMVQQRTVRPVGSNAEVPIKCRIVCATHQEPKHVLRNDLYWRLCTYKINITHMTNRIDDVRKFITVNGEDPDEILSRCSEEFVGGYREVMQVIKRARLSKKLVEAGTPPAQ